MSVIRNQISRPELHEVLTPFYQLASLRLDQTSLPWGAYLTRGEVNDGDYIALMFSNSAGGGGSLFTGNSDRWLFLARLETTVMPQIEIRRRNLGSRLGALFRKHRVTFAEDPPFARSHFVYANEEDATRRTLTAAVRAEIAKSDLNVQTQAFAIAVSKPIRRLKAPSPEFIETARRISDVLTTTDKNEPRPPGEGRGSL